MGLWDNTVKYIGHGDFTPGFSLGLNAAGKRTSDAVNNTQFTGAPNGYGGFQSQPEGPAPTPSSQNGGQVQGYTTTTTNQPHPENPASLGGGGSGGGSGGTSGGTSTYDPSAIMQYDLGIQQGNQALGRLDGQQGTALGNIEGQYNSAYNRLLGQQAQTTRDYDTNKTQQLQDYQGARENVGSQTRNLLLNTRRLLGSQGAGGGSADRFAAPNAAQQVGSAENAQVQQTNSRNLASLDTAYGDNERQFQTGFQDLGTQRDSGVRNTRSQFEQQRADILNNIAMLTGQKAIANGQNLQQAQAAVQPYTSRISGILNTIDGLAANPGVVREQQINLARPDLAQYQWNRFNAPQQAQQDPTLYTPATRLLLGMDNQDQRQLI